MATSTGGSNSTTILPFALQWQPGGLAPADVAAIKGHIKDHKIASAPIIPSAFENAQLVVPGRGILQIQPGDWIMIGTTGWPILIASNAMADWTHTP